MNIGFHLVHDFCDINPIIFQQYNEQSHETVYIIVEVKILIFVSDINTSFIFVILNGLWVDWSSIHIRSNGGKNESLDKDQTENFQSNRVEMFSDLKDWRKDIVFEEQFIYNG